MSGGERDPQAPVPTSQGDISKITSSVQTRLHLGRMETNTQGETHLRRPTRHLNTTRKMQDWSLSVGKKYLILGDSNVSKFPPYQYTDLQIDSYPGATFRHAEAILKKTTSSTNVERVVLSFGINNRTQKTRETTIKQLQKAIKEAKERFPQATIYVPEINFSGALPPLEQENLQQINKYIRDNCRYLPALQEMDFDTEGDNIHWTHSTAQKILKHWTAHLNCSSP